MIFESSVSAPKKRKNAARDKDIGELDLREQVVYCPKCREITDHLDQSSGGNWALLKRNSSPHKCLQCGHVHKVYLNMHYISN